MVRAIRAWMVVIAAALAALLVDTSHAATFRQIPLTIAGRVIDKLTSAYTLSDPDIQGPIFSSISGGGFFTVYGPDELPRRVGVFVDPQWSRIVYAVEGQPLYVTQGYGSGAGRFAHPQHIDVSPGGKLFVADTDNERVKMYAYSYVAAIGLWDFVEQFTIGGSTAFGKPMQVLWEDNGTPGTENDDVLWVLDRGRRRIAGYRLAHDGNKFIYLPYVSVGLDGLGEGVAPKDPACMAKGRYSPDGDAGSSANTSVLYIYDDDADVFFLYDIPRDGGEITDSNGPGVIGVTVCDNPFPNRSYTSLSVDPWGNVYGVAPGTSEIVKMTEALEALQRIGASGDGGLGSNEFYAPRTLTLEKVRHPNGVSVIGPNAVVVETWGATSGVQAMRLGVDASDLQLSTQAGSLALDGSWWLTDAARVRTEICHAWGTTVRTVEDELKLSAGTQTFTWDGLSDAGAVVPPCRNYLVRIRAISLYESPDTVTITQEFYHKPPIQKTLTVLGNVPGTQAIVNGSTVGIGGSGYALPCSVCTSVNLEVLPTQTLSGVKYCFDTWSDSGFRARSLELRWDSTTTAILVPTGSAPIPLSDGAVLFPDLLDCRSPHKILGDVTAPNGLTVHPGTTVRFMRTSPQGTTGVLRVSKYLTATDAIFETVDSTQNNVPAGEWAGILVNDPTGAAIAIRSCTVRNAITGLGVIDGGTVSSVTVEDCVFSENYRDIDVAFVDGASPGKSFRLARNYLTATTTQVKVQGADQAGDPWIAATIDTNTFAPSQNGSTLLKLTGGFTGHLYGNNLNLSPSNTKGIELGGAGTAYPNVVLRYNRFQNSSGRIALLSPGVAGLPVIDAQNNNWWQFSGEEIEDVITHYGSVAPDSPSRKAVVYIPFLTGGGAGGPGCPYVFAEAAGQFVVQNSILSRGHFGPSGGPPVWDAVELPRGDTAEEGSARFRIKEMGADTDVLDAVRVTAVRSSDDVRLATDSEGGIRAYRTLAALSGARSWTGRDAPFISPISPTQAYRGAPGDSLEFDVVCGDGIAIGRRFGFSLIPKPQEAPPIGGRVGVTVRVSRDAEGATWETLGDIVPREFWSTEVLATPGVEPGSVRRVRIVWHTPHLLGWAGLVEEVPVEQRILPTLRASHSDGTDATTRLLVADGRSATVRPGEYVEVEYDASDLRSDERPVVAVYGLYTSPSPGAESVVPARAFASQNRPNPFNPRTEIEFGLPAAGRVVVRVYDVAGRLVRHLVDREYPPGTHTISWDGRDRRGADAASGVYFYQARVGDGSFRHRMVLLR